jgi:hypothetical protein
MEKWSPLGVSVARNYDGSYTVSNVYRGEWYWQRYMGYSLREAKRRFRAYCVAEEQKKHGGKP